MTELTNLSLCDLEPFGGMEAMGINKTYYTNVTLNNSEYNQRCYLKIGKGLDNSTDFVYSEAESILAGIGAFAQGTAGFTLNFLLIYVSLTTPKIRKEWLTPYILSIAATDILWSGVVAPLLAIKYFTRLVL